MARVITAVPIANARPLADRVREAAQGLGCTILWARTIGRHVLLGLGESEAFARVTALGGNAFGLAFRSQGDDVEAAAAQTQGEAHGEAKWEPMLLIDDLCDVVEHALVAEGALTLEAACM
jgi:hypothetical protein